MAEFSLASGVEDELWAIWKYIADDNHGEAQPDKPAFQIHGCLLFALSGPDVRYEIAAGKCFGQFHGQPRALAPIRKGRVPDADLKKLRRTPRPDLDFGCGGNHPQVA